MARCGTGTKTFAFRLLTGIFFLLHFFLFSEDNHFAELIYSNGILSLDSHLFVEVKLNSRFADYQKLTLPPTLKIENEAIDLEDAITESSYGGTVIKNKYKLKKTGKFELTPKIVSQKKQLQLKSFFIQIEPPPLSEKTPFRWRIFSDITANNTADKIEEGKTYMLLLEGFFYNGTKNTNSYFELNYKTPENAVLEEFFPEPVHNKTDNYDGWKKTAVFLWTPLKNGFQFLPEIILSTKNENQHITHIRIPEKNTFVTTTLTVQKKNKAISNTQTAFESDIKTNSKKTVQPKTENDINYEIKKSLALKIADIRKKEYRSFFSNALKTERAEIEKKLKLKKTFSTHYHGLKKIIIAFFLFFVLLSAIIYGKTKRAVFLFCLFTVIAVCFFAAGIYIFTIEKHPKAVFVSNGEDTMYQIPEISGTAVGQISIGETVAVVSDSGEWLYIKKADGASGWLKKDLFIIIE